MCKYFVPKLFSRLNRTTLSQNLISFNIHFFILQNILILKRVINTRLNFGVSGFEERYPLDFALRNQNQF